MREMRARCYDDEPPRAKMHGYAQRAFFSVCRKDAALSVVKEVCAIILPVDKQDCCHTMSINAISCHVDINIATMPRYRTLDDIH